MTMNTVALGGIARPTARVAAKKSVTFGAPVAPKSATGFSVRRSVKPATVAEKQCSPVAASSFRRNAGEASH